MSNVNIPPDIAAVFEDFWDEMLLERFGPTPPSPAEEAAFIQEFLAQGIPTVPLPDGGRVDVVADGSADVGDLGAPDSDVDLESEGGLSSVPAWQIALFVIGAFVLLWPLIGGPIKGFVGGVFGGSGGNGGDGGEEVPIEAGLPEGIDSLVRSGDVRAPLVTPRTLEIQPSSVPTASTFVVVPVEVEEADWPCPTKKFKGEPAACWVFGTVVNYLVGIPSDIGARALFDDLQGGGSIHLRLSTEKVLRFTVDDVRQIERHQTEVLGQHHFGLTLVALGGKGAMRTIAQASYIPDEMASGWEMPEDNLSEGEGGTETFVTPIGAVAAEESRGRTGDTAPAQSHTVTLGERVDLSEMVSIVPVGLRNGGNKSTLVLRVENRGSLPYTPQWTVSAQTDDGEVVTGGIEQENDQITIEASKPATVWTIEASGQVIRVNTETGGS